MVKIQLKGLGHATVDLPEGKNIFVNGSLWPYNRGITNAKSYETKKSASILYMVEFVYKLRNLVRPK